MTVRIAVGRLDLDHVGAELCQAVVETGPAIQIAASIALMYVRANGALGHRDVSLGKCPVLRIRVRSERV